MAYRDVPQRGNNNQRVRKSNNTEFNASEYIAQREKEIASIRSTYSEEYQDIEREGLEAIFSQKEKLIKSEMKQRIAVINKIKALEEKQLKEQDKEEEKKYKKKLERYKKYLEKQEKLYKDYNNRIEKIASAQNKLDAINDSGNVLYHKNRENLRSSAKDIMTGKGYTMGQKVDAFKTYLTGGETGAKGVLNSLDKIVSDIGAVAKKLDNNVMSISKYQSRWDTRLLGSGKTFEGRDGISRTLTGVVGVSPYVKLESVMKNTDDLISQGISYNVEQRAFLQSISENIASTFDAANGTLLQLIRVQQSDTTAARLGLEGFMNSYLNSMYSNTEYMNNYFDTVSANLYEANSLLSSVNSVGVEGQVQKWLGSLYSVGMSSNAINSISSALGQLGSGDISGLGSGMQNLLMLSANRSDKVSYSDMLQNGLDAAGINDLMKSMVEYLSEIASSSTSNVVRNQYANMFGLSSSDLQAFRNLSGSVRGIYGTNINYGSAMSTLFDLAGSMGSRIGTAGLISNAFENMSYNLSTSIATNPALLAMWKVAGVLDEFGGGNIPTITALGTGIDLETSISDLLRFGAVGSGLIGSIGSLISAGSGAGFSSDKMLTALGINKNSVSVQARGRFSNKSQSGSSTSETIYIGGGNDDLYGQTMNDIENQKQEITSENNGEDEVTIEDINTNIVNIYRLFQDVIDGVSTLKVEYKFNQNNL